MAGKYHAKPFLPTKPLSVSLPVSACKLQALTIFDPLFNQSPHLYQWQPENTGDMVGPGIRTQDLSDENQCLTALSYSDNKSLLRDMNRSLQLSALKTPPMAPLVLPPTVTTTASTDSNSMDLETADLALDEMRAMSSYHELCYKDLGESSGKGPTRKKN